MTTDGRDAPPEWTAGATAASLENRCVCPSCRGRLTWCAEAIRCLVCGETYRRQHGIPIFTSLDVEADDPETIHKLGQAEFFDSESADWEIGRPQGAPVLHGWLLGEKFRRSVLGLESVLPGATALTVCGGSGMDAEFLARRGLRVITSDISLGAALRARERARRHQVEIFPIVADVEQLPFADRSLDITYVHDGLHHLRDPSVGLAEMVRVAAGAVSITEPARAAITRMAVRVGIAVDEEEAGNPVERVDARLLVNALRRGGFRVVGSGRYGMYYQHEPGPAMRLFSRRRAFPLARTTIRAFNLGLGRFGNKVSIRAIREAPPRSD